MVKIKKKTVLSLGIALILLGVGFKLTGFVTKVPPGQYDEFAQCLTDSGAKMYGAYWCPHCANQKAMFGSSWRYVNYVECSLPNKGGQTKVCSDAGITGYPTWEFGNGIRTSGELSLQALSIRSGCKL